MAILPGRRLGADLHFCDSCCAVRDWMSSLAFWSQVERDAFGIATLVTKAEIDSHEERMLGTTSKRPLWDDWEKRRKRCYANWRTRILKENFYGTIKFPADVSHMTLSKNTVPVPVTPCEFPTMTSMALFVPVAGQLAVPSKVGLVPGVP
jgi:hypothetical protein